MKKQVEKEHYRFLKYMNKNRWCSIWHQLNEVMETSPRHVLEIGPGPGTFKMLAVGFGLKVETLDIAEDLNPDIIASATDIPRPNNSFDVVCSFQMLEHLPFETSMVALKEMARVSKEHIILSLPDAEPCWPFKIYFPKLGERTFLMRRPFTKPKIHNFDGEHYWEINAKGYELKVIKQEMLKAVRGFELVKTYKVSENPYHRFFIFSRFDEIYDTE